MVNDDPQRFQEGRHGNQMLVPFQCDTCQFMNVKKRLSCIGNVKGDLLLVCLHRVILNSMWSRERSAVQGNLNLARSLLVDGQALGSGIKVYPALGSFPIGGQSGVGIACIMMLRSLKPGKNSKTIQFETLQKTRSCHANYLNAS